MAKPPSDLYRPSARHALQHLRWAIGHDGHQALVGVRRLLRDDIPWLEARAVRLARGEGMNWAQIGRLLRRSRQAVRQRHGHQTNPSGPSPDDWRWSPPTLDAWIVWTHGRSATEQRRRQEFFDLAPDQVVPW